MSPKKKPVRHQVRSYRKSDGSTVRSHQKGSGDGRSRKNSKVVTHDPFVLNESSLESFFSELEEGKGGFDGDRISNWGFYKKHVKDLGWIEAGDGDALERLKKRVLKFDKPNYVFADIWGGGAMDDWRLIAVDPRYIKVVDDEPPTLFKNKKEVLQGIKHSLSHVEPEYE